MSTELFKPMDSNKAIETYDPRRQSNLAKGAFSSEARDSLANALKKKPATVQMDGREMQCKWYDDYVYVVAVRGGLPCGTFSYDTLKRRPWRDVDNA